jgi:5-methylcytosine-specific restriction endonuclease McrA
MALKGVRFSDEHKANMSKSQAGHFVSKESKLKNKLSHLGKIHSDKTKKRMSEYRKKMCFKPPVHIGKDNVNWKGGITSLRQQIYHSFKNRQWISDIFTRDDFTCQICGKRGEKLEAHHIKQFAIILKENKIKTFEDAIECDELWNINNGLTLCKKCHKKQKIIRPNYNLKFRTS